MPVDSYKWLPYSLAAWIQKEYRGPEERDNTPFTPLAKPLSETRFALLTTGGLYLRTMDALEDRLIPGTNGATANPFLSPDGQSVGFFRLGQGGQELVRLAVTGGAPVKLADVDAPFGATWETDDTILYGQADGIWQVSENGGAPEHLIATEPNVEQAYGPQDNIKAGRAGDPRNFFPIGRFPFDDQQTRQSDLDSSAPC